MTFFELITQGIDPLRIKCPGVGSQSRSCHKKTCIGNWSDWSEWSQCSESCTSEYKSRASKCIGGVCKNSQTSSQQSNLDSNDPNRRTVYLGTSDRVEIELCGRKNCPTRPDSKICQNGQTYIPKKPSVVTCRDLSFIYKEMNITDNFSNFNDIKVVAQARYFASRSSQSTSQRDIGGCYCPTGMLMADNNTCIPYGQCGCVDEYGISHFHGEEIVSSDGCEVCHCSGGLATGCQKKAKCEGACKWTNWSDFGPCLGACGSNGIQWSFRNTVGDTLITNPNSTITDGNNQNSFSSDSNANCVGIFQKSRRCMTDACPFCIDETGYDENANESNEHLVERLHKYGDQWTPVGKKEFPCHICTCLDNGTIACAKYCQLQNVGCPSGQELIVPDDSEDECCYCYDPSATTIGTIISTMTNFFTTIRPSITNYDPDSDTERVLTTVQAPIISPDRNALDKCKRSGSLVCDVKNDGTFTCLNNDLICDNVNDCEDAKDEDSKICSDSCHYSRWSEWSECSQSCDMGVQERFRALHPLVDTSNVDCDDFTDYSENRPCMLDACAIDGGWSNWKKWSGECNCKNSNFPIESTVRYCNSPTPANGGKYCQGIHYKERICKNLDDPLKSCKNITCNLSDHQLELDVDKPGSPPRDCTNLFKQAHPRTACGKLAVSCTDILEKDCSSVIKPSPTFSIHQWCQKKPVCMCAPGYLLQNGECVSPSACQCQMNSNMFSIGGQSIVVGFSAGEHIMRNKDRGPIQNNFPTVDSKEGCTECKCILSATNLPDINCQYHHNANVCQKVDCGYNNWSSWSTCQRKCKNISDKTELSLRFRYANNPPAKFGGKPCIGDNRQTKSCDDTFLPFCNSYWSNWSEWSKCSTTCGFGLKSRSRECLGGNKINCQGYYLGGNRGVESCGSGKLICPTDGTICPEDTSYELCPEVCATCECDNFITSQGSSRLTTSLSGNHVCESSCVCKDPHKRYHNGKCIYKKNCPCQVTENEITRSFTVGEYFTMHGCSKCQCVGNGNIKCDHKNCKHLPGQWSNWSEWGACSATCSSPGHIPFRNKFRKCLAVDLDKQVRSDSYLENLDIECHSSGQQGKSTTEFCNLKPCQTDVMWSEWSSWSSCSVTCGSGLRKRIRNCQTWTWNKNEENQDKLTARKEIISSEICQSHLKNTKREDYEICIKSACLDGCSGDKYFIDTCINERFDDKCETCYDVDKGRSFHRGYQQNNKKCTIQVGSSHCGPKCICRPGTFMLENSTCVPAEKCPCYIGSKAVDVGDSYQADSCRKCTCLGFQEVKCKNECDISDPDNKICGWSNWSSWSGCSSECGGVKIRTRHSRGFGGLSL